MALHLSQVGRIVSHMEPTWPTSIEVAETVKRAIANAGKSQREVAEMSGVPLTTLNRRLNTGSPFVYEELVSVARVIGCRVSDLISEAERLASTSSAA